MKVWSVVLLSTSIGGLVFGNITSGRGAIGVSATSVIIGYFGVGKVVPNLKWISDISTKYVGHY